jgi:uncharacterized paraquat-inducible protein A
MNMITYDEEYEGNEVHLCINCDSEFNVTKIDDEPIQVSFCPFCGYDMHEEEEDEEFEEEDGEDF